MAPKIGPEKSGKTNLNGDECHKKAKRWQEYEQALAAGEALPKKQISITVPDNAPIKSGMNKMHETEKETLAKLFNTAYFIVKKGPPFIDFTDLIVLQKVNGMDFTTSCKNSDACKEFVLSISNYLFDKEISEKLKQVNFNGILCDGSTDKSLYEQEVL